MSYIPNKPMTSNLEEYIISDGEWYPNNYAEYQTPDILDQLCPLCHEYHNNYKAFMFGPHGREIRAHMCEECAFEVDLSDAARKAYRPDIKSNRVHARLSRYKNYGILPTDADKFTNKIYSCMFCNGGVDTSNFMPINLPVDAESFSNGGVVSVCSTCADYLDWKEYHLDVSDKCPRCGDAYPISERESELRSMKNTSGQHICPTCFQGLHGTLSQERFISIGCHCERSQIIDLFTIWEDNPMPEQGFFCNAECRLALPPANNYEIVIWHYIDETSRLMLYKKQKHDIKWHLEYQVRRENEKIWEIRKTKSYENKDAADILWEELNYVSKIPKQLTFNLNM